MATRGTAKKDEAKYVGLKRSKKGLGWVSSADGGFFLSSLTTVWCSASPAGGAALLMLVQLGDIVEAVAPELGHDAA